MSKRGQTTDCRRRSSVATDQPAETTVSERRDIEPVRLPSPQTTTRTALRYGATAGLAGTATLNATLQFAGGGFSIPSLSTAAATLASAVILLVFYVFCPTVVFGTPVALYLRLGVVSPAVVLVGAVGFWLVVAGHPRWVVAFVLLQGIPMGVLYGVVGTLEWYVRDRRGTLPPASVS